MTQRSRVASFVAATMVVAFGFVDGATAQTVGARGATGSTGSMGATPLKVLSAPEQQAAAEQIVSNATVLSQRVTQMLDEARRDADVIRVTCLNDKLTQVNANLRAAQARAVALQKAVDTELRNHEFTVISVLGQKLQVLEQEANQCVGQDLYETGMTNVVTEIDNAMVPFEHDPGQPPMMLPPTLFEVPPDGTPFGA